MSISISEVQSLAGCAIDDDLDGWPEIALTNVVRMPLVLGLGDSAAALELERRPETVFGELEI